MKILLTIILCSAAINCFAGTVNAYQDGRDLFYSENCQLNSIENTSSTNLEFYVFCNVQDLRQSISINSSKNASVFVEVSTGDEFNILCPIDTFDLALNPNDFNLILNCNNKSTSARK